MAIVAAVLLAVFAISGAAFAAMGKVDGFTFSQAADRDVVGDGNALAPDGKPDAEFSVRLGGSAGAISAFTLKNLSTGQTWSSAGGSAGVLGVVDGKGAVVNSSFPKVAFVLAADFKLYVNNRAAITAAGGEFEVSVKFIDNSTATARVAIPASAPVSPDEKPAEAPAGAPASPAPASPGSGKIISSAFKGVGNYDLSDGTKKLGSNMSPDYRFDVSLAGTDTLTGVRVRATGGGSPDRVWDSVPTTSNPLVVVTDQGKGTPLNAPDGSVSIPVKDLRDLSLWVDGGDEVKRQDFRLTFLFSGGRIEETDIKQAAAPAAAANSGGRGQGQRNIPRALQMKAKPAQIKLDVVGKNRLKKASGVKDFSLMINVRGEGKIEAVSVINQIGKGRWDTIPGSASWLLLVRKGGSQVNDAKNFSVSIPMKGGETLELLMEDDGTLAKKEGRLLLSVTWDDGEVVEELITW
jgi:hypothetical protein